MVWPLIETLDLVEPHLPNQLISPTTFCHVKALANFLPNAMYSYYLECRMDANTTQVDFLTSATARGGRKILAGHNAEVDLPDVLLENSLWRRIRKFFEYWAEPTSPLYNQVPVIWLEFDQVANPRQTIPLPGACYCLDPKYLERPAQLQPSNHINTQQYRQIVTTASEILLGHSVRLQTRENLIRCFNMLPAGGRIIHISTMLSRQPVTLKVYGSIPRQRLLTYLAHIEWAGSIEEVDKILTTYCPTLDPIFIDLTVNDTISPRIGIAFSQIHLISRAQRDPTWKELLDQCVAGGMCSSEKRDGLIAWPGTCRVLYNGDAWPTQLRRWLDIKLVYQPHQPLEAKAYLGFMPYFSLF